MSPVAGTGDKRRSSGCQVMTASLCQAILICSKNGYEQYYFDMRQKKVHFYDFRRSRQVDV